MDQVLAPPKPDSERTFLHDENAFLDLNSISGTLSGIIKVVAVLTIIGATIGLLFTSIADIVGAFTTGTTNSTTADLLLPVMGLLVALAGVFLIVRKDFEAAQ